MMEKTNDKTTELLNILSSYTIDINANNGTLQKASVFKSYYDKYPDKTQGFLRIITLIYDDLVRFNVTSKNVLKYRSGSRVSKKPTSEKPTSKSKSKTTINTFFTTNEKNNEKTNEKTNDDKKQSYDIFELLQALSSRTITGNQALGVVCDYLDYYPKYEDIILNIIDKDLKTRFTASNINKIIPGLIPVFDVSLGNPYDESTKKHTKNGEWFISRKLDGVRCICIVKLNDKTEPEIRFYSRQGNEFETLTVLKEEIIKNVLPLLKQHVLYRNGCVFDGEICKIDNTGKEDFQGIMKEINKGNHTIENPRYLLFDMLTNTEFTSLVSERLLKERLDSLNDIIKTIGKLSKVEQIPFNETSFKTYREYVKNEGWEGLILRKNAKYQGKRSNDILKVKEFFREEYKVIDIESSTIRVINEDTGLEEEILTMKSVIIEHKGYRVNVGSGFKLNERKDFFANPEKIVGKIISVQYFEETTDKNGNLSLRFPTFLGVYGTERTF